jgi:hypothetical protein
MHGTDEKFVTALADEVRADRSLTERDRASTMQLLCLVSAAILGSDETADAHGGALGHVRLRC